MEMKELLTVLMMFELVLVATMLMEYCDFDSNLRAELQEQVANLTSEKATLEESYQRLNVSYHKLLKQYDDAIDELYECRHTKDAIPLNASYKRVMDFIRRDKTDQLEYDEDEFDCTDFTATLLKNALKEGIFGCPVYIMYPNAAHTIAAFPTSDRGIVYIEPQDDTEVVLEVGKSYNNLNYDYEFYIGYDDTIVKVVTFCGF